MIPLYVIITLPYVSDVRVNLSVNMLLASAPHGAYIVPFVSLSYLWKEEVNSISLNLHSLAKLTLYKTKLITKTPISLPVVLNYNSSLFLTTISPILFLNLSFSNINASLTDILIEF